jgi:mannose-6-phosphate isomerase-like protein (cupin superfamily)
MVNPVTGDRLWFTHLPRTAGDPVVFECELPARSPGTPLHIHTRTTERFECLSGTLSMVAGDRANPITLSAGQHVDVPINTSHRFWNATDQPVRIRSTVTPGVEFEQFLRTVYALAIAGRVSSEGMPRNPLQLAVLRELSDLYFAGLPLLIQRPVFGILSAIASLAGTGKQLAQLVSESRTCRRRTP